MKNLYLLSTVGLGQFHVIANNPTQAEQALFKIFNEQDYGFKEDRRIVKIEWVAESFKPYSTNSKRPFLSDKSARLFIVQDWL